MEITIPIENLSRRDALFGTGDRNLRLVRAAFEVRLTARDGAIRISGPAEAVQKATQVIEELQRALRTESCLRDEELEELISRAEADRVSPADERILDVFLPSVVVTPKGEGQQAYADAILGNDLTFCAGPAGTGKTYLAVAASVSLLKRHRIKRIVLVRPAVEAGEKLGYLPGDLQAKVNPYLRPLYDAMHDMMSFDQLKRFMQNDIIEVVPLAFMRGRTLNNAAIILDEAQNATPTQMLMFLTRLGHESKMIVTGDDSQSDLREGSPSGFVDALVRLRDVEGASIVRLTKQDIVRHPLVQRVVEVYADRADDVR